MRYGEHIIITESIPFEIKLEHPAYLPTEAIQEVKATMAFEDMDLTDEEIRMLYAYKKGEVSGDGLRRQILSEVGGTDDKSKRGFFFVRL